MERRGFLKASAALAAGAFAAHSGTPRRAAATATNAGPGQTQPAGVAPQQARRAAARFFEDEALNFSFLTMLGLTYDRAADIGACLAIADQIDETKPASAVAALTSAGDRLAAQAEAAAAAGLRVTAREAWMQASTYTFFATSSVDPAGTPERFGPLWLKAQQLWDRATDLFDPPVERFRIPYEGTTLPGYFYRVDDSGRRRPLAIVNNGSDGGPMEIWPLVAAALRRGYNALTFWGPGEGPALLEQKLYFRPDWEKVITPVVDAALTRSEVDPSRIALLGVSQAGYWVPRAVAFEYRIAAAVADPGVVDVAVPIWNGIVQMLPPFMQQQYAAGQKEAFDRAMAEALRDEPEAAALLAFRSRPYGFTSYYDVLKAVQQYNLRGVVDRIRCPMLITDPEGEQFWPDQSQQLYDLLPGPKTLVKFTAAEGADLHCEPKAQSLRTQRMYDWLDRTLGYGGGK